MYRDLNDYEILYLISDNNDDGYEILLEKYQGLFVKFINKYKYSLKSFGYEEDDLYQICSLTLYSTLKKYDGDANDNLFFTYLSKAIENAIFNIMKVNNTNKKRVLNESISYDNEIPNSKLTYIDILPDLKNQDLNDLYEYKIRYINYKNSFDFDISCILELKVEGYKVEEIARLLELSDQEVMNGIKVIRNYL